MRYKIIDHKRFLACLMVLVIVFGLYAAIGTIERRHELQMEQNMLVGGEYY